jgi:hypothetical protein
MQELKLPKLNGGLNLRDLEYKIDDTQSPKMLNMWNRDGVLSKRWGQAYVNIVDTTGSAVTLGTVHSISPEFEGKVAVHAGTKLYEWTTSTNVMRDLGVSVADTTGAFLEFNSNLYHLDGTEIRQINNTYSCTTITPYAPLVYINCIPDMTASEANEAYNLIGAGFKVQYNGDSTSTLYHLPLTVLDATAVTVTVGAQALTENTHFTVDRTAGTVNFAAGTLPHGAPITGTDNVEITAYKTIKEADGVTPVKNRITGCKFGIAFGGESTDIAGGTRAFLMKNSAYPSTYWYSDLGGAQGYGMTYFPDTQYELLSQNNEPITTAAKQAGELIIFKTSSLFSISYVFDGTQVFYPIREFNSAIGCDMPGSVQLIDNNLVFGNSRQGVFMIASTAGTAEENVKPISGNINGSKLSPGLLQEPDILTATSIDFDRKYWLCTGSNVYLWDYGQSPFYGYSDYDKAQRRLAWYRFSNISADIWYGDTSLYYASANKIVKFHTTHADFGETIEAYWYSKAFDFGASNYLKTITQVWPSVRVDTNSSILFQISNEKKEISFEKELAISNFSWLGFNWASLSWNVQKYAKPFKLKPKMKKIVYCQLKFYNNDQYRDMGITDIVLEFFVNGKVKR